MKNSIIYLSMALTCALSTAATAEIPSNSRTVSYADLDLTLERDIKTFDDRIGEAVVALCRPTYQGGEVQFEYLRRCRFVTHASVVEPRAKALEAAKSKQLAGRSVTVAALDQ